MSAAALASPVPTSSDRLYQLLDKVDYRVAATDEDREAIFRLRYDAYIREHMIAPSFSKSLSDKYDSLDNTTVFGVWIDGELVSTLRISVGTDEYPEMPAMAVFPDVIEPEIALGKVVVDATRFATNEVFTRTYPGITPHLTTRIAWMASEYYGADLFLGSVRIEHQAYYRRAFSARVASEPRIYHGLSKPLCLMVCDYQAEKERVQHRTPLFRSTYFERRAMFEWQRGIPMPRKRPVAAVPLIDVEHARTGTMPS